MYQDFYGLTAKPFSLTPDPEYFYGSSSHANALELVRHGLRQRSRRDDVDRHQRRRQDDALPDDPPARRRHARAQHVHGARPQSVLTADELLQVILQDFGVISREEASAGRLAQVASQDLLRTLHDFLRSLVPLGAAAVLIVDEAQKLSLPMLAAVAAPGRVDREGRPLLQILLVGSARPEGRPAQPRGRRAGVADQHPLPAPAARAR